MKRFWDTVTIAEDDGEHRILLDGKPIHIPGGGVLRVGPAALAQAVGEEWRLAGGGRKGGDFAFEDTPLTRIAGTAREKILPDPVPTADAIARYGENDMLCYRASEPAELVARQDAQWQPWLDWAERTYAAPLRVTTGVSPIRQHRDSIAALRDAVWALNPYQLAGLGIAVPALGSLVLGLALADGLLDAEEAHALGALEELFQAEQWGEDDEAVERRTNIAADIAVAARFLRLARMG